MASPVCLPDKCCLAFRNFGSVVMMRLKPFIFSSLLLLLNVSEPAQANTGSIAKFIGETTGRAFVAWANLCRNKPWHDRCKKRGTGRQSSFIIMPGSNLAINYKSLQLPVSFSSTQFRVVDHMTFTHCPSGLSGTSSFAIDLGNCTNPIRSRIPVFGVASGVFKPKPTAKPKPTIRTASLRGVKLGRTYSVLIRAKHSGKCLDVAGGKRGNNANIQQYTCSKGAGNQTWKLIPFGDGSQVEIRAKHSNRCMDVAGGRKGQNVNIQQYTCSRGASNQTWLLRRVGARGWAIVSKMANRRLMCLDIGGGSKQNNANVQTYPCSFGASNQTFSFH